MGDDHLKSMHLEWPRREAFRHARASLLEACGEYTQMGGSGHSPYEGIVLQNLENRLPENLEYGLMDRDSIYPLKVGINTIGRMPDNDVVIEDPHVSRRHCAIVVHARDGFELHDVASKNGTYLNGMRIATPTPLASGDEIRMCDRQLIFLSRHPLRPDATLPR